MRKIAVVTGTRAEYGMLRPLLEKLRGSDNLELELIVTGMHLLEEYGLTINEIIAGGFKVAAEVQMYAGSEAEIPYHGKSLAKGINGFTNTLGQIKPQILVVIGDRLEPLAATLAAATLRLPTAHIHGGDKTDSGHIDESIRHSITRFAHLHFPPTSKCAERLTKMGEESWRIHSVGALGLDTILNQQAVPKEKLLAELGLNPGEAIIVCIFHPVHLERDDMGKQMHEIIEALKEFKLQTVVIYPNNDAGSQEIIAEIEKARDLSFLRVFVTIPYLDYVGLLKCADVLIGNSSSGIIEAPSLKLPVVNIGSRNLGREHAENVIFVNAIRSEIVEAIQTVLYDEKFRESVKQCKNPWGDGKTSDRIVKVLSEVVVDRKLLQKRITY